MSKQQQVVILKMIWDADRAYKPSQWNWTDLLGRHYNTVEAEVMNYGVIENNEENAS
jgi:hypothetical protein